jgi:hypothetical protein
MLKNAFAGRANRPTEQDLSSVLGAAEGLWRDLIADLKHDLKLDAEVWNCYSIKAGWSLRLQLKKRNIVYLSPGAGCFLASFALGDKAVAAALRCKLPQTVHKMIHEAKRYAEGTAVRIEVRDNLDGDVVKTLARIKVDN